MKIKCCRNCVVDPICTAGCDDLWLYYKSLEKKSSKHVKIMRVCLKVMLTLSIVHGLVLVTGLSVPIKENHYRIEYLGFTYWYWWFGIIYMIPVVINIYSAVDRAIIKKVITKINGGKRTWFIREKEHQDKRGNTAR